MNFGIESMSFAIPRFYLDLATLAAQNGTDIVKYHQGLGQEKMAIAPHDEDIVTLACKAAKSLITHDIDTVLFATETGIDQSKAAGLYVHNLLNLPKNCRVVELKQACYSATAALQLAAAYVAQKPHKKVLLIASDIARYDLNSAAEATQGAGAVALLISANPHVATMEPISGCYSEDVMDFWRPNHRRTPLVDGRFSTLMYLKALENAYHDYKYQGGTDDFAAFCYHLPFTKMGLKAHERLCKISGIPFNLVDIEDGFSFNRQVGNCYSAGLYLSLMSLMFHRDDLSGQRVACFSYGSGMVGEFFTLKINDNYQNSLHITDLSQRKALTYEQYLTYWHENNTPENSHSGSPRFIGVKDNKRIYQ